MKKRKGWAPHLQAAGQVAMIEAQCKSILKLKVHPAVHFTARQILELAGVMKDDLRKVKQHGSK